jgi:chromosome partitioning protein
LRPICRKIDYDGVFTPGIVHNNIEKLVLRPTFLAFARKYRQDGGRSSMRVIAIVNQKGGCGKTTVSVNLASAIAQFGYKTLLVDMDPQSHCAVGLAVPEEQIEQSIYDVLISESRHEPLRLSEILWQISERLDLAPASIDLSAYEQQMIGVPERENCLKKIIDEQAKEYDYVIVDCPPAVGILTFNALRAASDVIVPVETGYFSLHGLSRQLETLNILCERCSQQINVKILASMYDIRTKMAREILSELRQNFGDKMFRTVVNFNTKIKEAASFGQPISEYDPASKGHADFRAFAEELVGIESKTQSRNLVNTLAGQLETISASANELLKTAKPAIKTAQKIAKQQPEPSESEIAHFLNTPKEELLQIKAAIDRVNAPKEEVLELEEIIDEPVAVEKIAEAVAVEKTDEQLKVELDEKLSDYYGVSQSDGAVLFVTLYPRASNVQIAGDFNNWQPEKNLMEKVGESGVWQTKIKLPAGKYRYRLVVDGQWQQDPYNGNIEPNPFGGFNSVLEVK